MFQLTASACSEQLCLPCGNPKACERNGSEDTKFKEMSSARARTCSDGTLGAWGAWDKTPAQASCNQGCSIAVHGHDVTEERTMYLEALPNNTCTAEEQTRSAQCQDGSIVPVGAWSGSYASSECVGGCGEAKYGQLHIETRLRYMEELASSECVSEVQTRQRLCGEAGAFGEWLAWSGENGYTYEQCVVGCGQHRAGRLREPISREVPRRPPRGAMQTGNARVLSHLQSARSAAVGPVRRELHVRRLHARLRLGQPRATGFGRAHLVPSRAPGRRVR